jgi:hypothetical protein
LSDGETKPISKVDVGDHVVATDPSTGSTQTHEVTHLWKHQDELIRLKTDAGVVTTTAIHPFWEARSKKWVPAAPLKPGDELRSTSGTNIRVTASPVDTGKRGDAYNLTVDQFHTYYVVDGNRPVLVHNEC